MSSVPATRSRVAARGRLLVGGTLVLAVLLRFPLLGAKSFWGDEVSTLFLIRRGFDGLLAGVARLESTPPLYYTLAKLWDAVAGNGEVGLRSLPAALGVGAVAVSYLAARELVSPRAAVMTAALMAVNPMLIWYSGDARSYSLAVLLAAVGLLFFARALNGRPRAVGWWALASSLALATHYFSAFLIAPEACVLLCRSQVPRRAALLAIGTVGATAAALFPLALEQRAFGHADWIARTPLPLRILRAPADLLVGFDAPQVAAVGAVAVALAAAGGWLAWKRVWAPAERRGVALAAAVGAAAVALPAALAAVGVDYFDSRNVIEAIVPLTIAIAAGFAVPRSRGGAAAACALCALSLFVVVATMREPKYHSEDWRAAARALGDDGRSVRVVVVTPGQAGRKPLMVYLGESTRPVFQLRTRVAEIDLVIAPRQGASTPRPRDVHRLESLHLAGFHLAVSRSDTHYAVFRLRARTPRSLSVRSVALALGGLRPAVLLEH